MPDHHCKFCTSKLFPTQQTLHKHYKTRHSEEANFCIHCDKFFANKNSVKTHLSKIRKVEDSRINFYDLIDNHLI